MRHYKKSGMKLGTDASHTKAMKKSLCQALFANDRIKTTLPRAKAIRGDVDRIVTWAKRGDLHSRRLAIAKLGDKELVREVDKDRSSYYKYYTDQIWGESGNYDLCIDTSTCTLDEAAARIADRFRAMA